MNILFTVCGRAGSKGFKNKNLKNFEGYPLIYYTLAVIKLFKEKYNKNIIDVVLNTDSIDLIDLVKKQDFLKDIEYIKRAEILSGDLVPKVDVIKDCLLKISKLKLIKYDYIIDLDITSPLRTLNDIENALAIMKDDKQCDVVLSVVKSRRNPYFNMVEEKGCYYKKVCESNFTTRQTSPTIYDLNASIYVYNSNFLLGDIDRTLLDYNCKISEMTDYLVLDIDSEEDFKLMSILYPIFCKENEKLKEIKTVISENLSHDKEVKFK